MKNVSKGHVSIISQRVGNAERYASGKSNSYAHYREKAALDRISQLHALAQIVSFLYLSSQKKRAEKESLQIARSKEMEKKVRR